MRVFIFSTVEKPKRNQTNCAYIVQTPAGYKDPPTHTDWEHTHTHTTPPTHTHTHTTTTQPTRTTTTTPHHTHTTRTPHTTHTHTHHTNTTHNHTPHTTTQHTHTHTHTTHTTPQPTHTHTHTHTTTHAPPPHTHNHTHTTTHTHTHTPHTTIQPHRHTQPLFQGVRNSQYSITENSSAFVRTWIVHLWLQSARPSLLPLIKAGLLQKPSCTTATAVDFTGSPLKYSNNKVSGSSEDNFLKRQWASFYREENKRSPEEYFLFSTLLRHFQCHQLHISCALADLKASRRLCPLIKNSSQCERAALRPFDLWQIWPVTKNTNATLEHKSSHKKPELILPIRRIHKLCRARNTRGPLLLAMI